jgi:hypothetical protein
MSVRLRITCIVALVASASATVMVFLAGIAVACSGDPLPPCETTPTVATEAATLITESSAVLHGKVNPEGCKTNFVFEYGPTKALGFFTTGGAVGSKEESVSDAATGLQPGTEYYFRISATNNEGKSSAGSVLTFTTTSNKPPVITTEAATDVLSTTATLNGSVDPEGAETTYEFEYGVSTLYGSKSEAGKVSSGFTPQKVNKSISGLSPETTYHYRIVAKSSHGIATPGADKTFKTSATPGKPPTVTTEAATDVLATNVTLNGSVNPEGAETTYEFEYGTSTSYGKKSESGKLAAGFSAQKVNKPVTGLAPETTYHYRVVAKNIYGSATPGADKTFTTSSAVWKIKETPNPGGASDSNLYDVSCNPSTKACTSVGKSTASGIDSPLAQRWNGTSWSEQTAAKKSGATHTRLFGVDCPSETRCLAVGNHQSSEGPSVLSEIWNEGKWTVQTTPLPSEATSSEFAGIGCNSTATCTAVGSAIIGGVKKAIAERWTSPTWALSSIPIPEGAKASQLDGVDCLWSNFCVAVGRYTTNGGAVKSLVLFWNGTEWSLQTVTDPAGAIESSLIDASCTGTPNRCTAVGVWKNIAGEKLTLAYRFNGTSTWTLQTTPNPPGSIESVFQDVSCATETSCTAAGSWLVSGGSVRTLAEKWDGTSWAIEGSQDPATAAFSAFLGVSCQESSCFGAGWSTNALGVDTTLAEYRE